MSAVILAVSPELVVYYTARPVLTSASTLLFSYRTDACSLSYTVDLTRGTSLSLIPPVEFEFTLALTKFGVLGILLLKKVIGIGANANRRRRQKIY